MKDQSFIVGVAGIPGSGKSRLAHDAAAAFPGAVHLEFDIFETLTHDDPAILERWLEGEPVFETSPQPELCAALSALKNGKTARLPDRTKLGPAQLVFFEAPLGRTHDASGAFIDALVWLDCPPDIALARNIKHWMDASPAQERTQFQHWLADYLELYQRVLTKVAAHQECLVKPGAEIIIENTECGSVPIAALGRALEPLLASR